MRRHPPAHGPSTCQPAEVPGTTARRLPPITWALMHHTTGHHSWMEQCMESCQWMLYHYDSKLPLDTSSLFQDWVQFVRLDPNWKGRVRKTSKLALSYHRARADHAIWQRHFDHRLAAAGATLPDKSKPQTAPERWQCDLCQKVFSSTRALAMHAARGHGYRKKVRYFAIGDTCQACGQNFHTRKRLSVHYEKQQKCYDIVTACWPPFPAAMVQSLDMADKEDEVQLRKQGWWAAKAFQPVQQTQGPPLPSAGSAAAQAMHDKMMQRRPSDELAYTQLQGTRITKLPPADPSSGGHVPTFRPSSCSQLAAETALAAHLQCKVSPERPPCFMLEHLLWCTSLAAFAGWAIFITSSTTAPWRQEHRSLPSR